MVRLWVSSVDYQNEVPFCEELFQQTGESYRRIRNTHARAARQPA